MSGCAELIVRYGELVPCKTAFIDTHTPGSHQKENFTIIGPGVSESRDKFVHIHERIGFNIGAAGQPPHCVNSLHTHTTAEVFFVLKGRWKFFWGLRGDAGDVLLEEGDLINIPTGVFRGFRNVGTEYGMLMAVMGGDDSGGGVTWAPQVLSDAQAHGLLLGDDGKLYDTLKGEAMPPGVAPKPPLTKEQLQRYPEPTARQLVPRCVARYLDMLSQARGGRLNVLGANGLLQDRPGFEIDFVSLANCPADASSAPAPEVLMPFKGHWRVDLRGESHVLNPGDTCLIPPGEARRLSVACAGESALFRITATTDPAGPSRIPGFAH
jgi:quercetin dioxygenase-like cupin family protein